MIKLIMYLNLPKEFHKIAQQCFSKKPARAFCKRLGFFGGVFFFFSFSWNTHGLNNRKQGKNKCQRRLLGPV